MSSKTNTKDWTHYIDNYGFVVHHDSDGGGGDSAQRTGMYYFAKYLKCKRVRDSNGMFFKLALNKIKVVSKYIKDLEYIRHPDHTKWYGKLGTMSRDQMIPLVCCMGAWQLKKHLIESFVCIYFYRLGFLWNRKHIGELSGNKLPDHAGFSLTCAFMRSFRSGFLYPIILVLDLSLFISSLIRIISSIIDPDNVGDDLNHQVLLAQSKHFQPTPISMLAIWIYKRFRLQAGPDRLHRLHGPGYQTALDWYFRHPECPPMNELWRGIL